MSRPAILTLDLGTTRLKVAAYDLAGTLLARFAARHREYRDASGAWQSADDWWQDAAMLIRRLLEEHPDCDIAAVSVSGRGGAGVFLDAGGTVLQQPWLDARHAGELKVLLARGDASHYAATLLAKFGWLRAHEPRIADRVHYACYAKDLLILRLTDALVTDPGSGPDALVWPGAALAEAGVDERILPAIELPWALAGSVTAAAARATGLPQGIPVAVGAHDGIAANIGAGAIGDGDYCLTLGTHAVIRAVTQASVPGAHRFYGMPPDRHIQGGNAVLAGRSLDWFLDHWLDADESSRPALFDRLDGEAASVAAGAAGVTFLPFLAGTIAPERRPGARAAFLGLSADATTLTMYRAVLEGTSFAIARIYRQVAGWAGPASRIGVTGSGALSGTWTQMLADVIGVPLTVTDGASEGRGAACCAAVAIGTYPDLAAATRGMVHISREVVPDPAMTETFATIEAAWVARVEALVPFDIDSRPTPV